MTSFLIQVDDLSSVECYLEIFGFTRISHTSTITELKNESSDAVVVLVPQNIFRSPHVGAMISVATPALPTLANSVKSFGYNHSWICDGSILLVEGPCSVNVLCYSSYAQASVEDKDDGAVIVRSIVDVLAASMWDSISDITMEDVPQKSTDSMQRFSEGDPSSRKSIESVRRRPLHSMPSYSEEDSHNGVPLIDNFRLHVGNIGGAFTPFYPNARIPIDFQNEFFVGRVVLVVRTKPLDPFYRHLFEGNKRMYVVQVQGQFKKAIPNAHDVYVGLESTCSMGMMSKSICRAMLKFLSKSLPSGAVQHSLGDGRSNAAFVSAPLLSCVDRMSVTPSGSEAPSMRYEFVEPPDKRSVRKSGRYSASAMGGKHTAAEGFDTTSTYSFTIKGKYIDFCEWSTCGFRMMNPTNLGTFIGANSSLRLVVFCRSSILNDVVSGGSSPRAASPTPTGAARRPGLAYLFEVDIAAAEGAVRTSQFLDPNFSRDSDSDNDDLDIADEINIPSSRSCTPDSTPSVNVAPPSKIMPPEEANGTSIRGVAMKDPVRPVPNKIVDGVATPLPSPRERVVMNWGDGEDMQYCMAAIEIDDYRRGRSRRVAYVVGGNNGNRTRLRSYMQLAAVMPLLLVNDFECGPRLAPTEIRRRQLAISMKKMFMVGKNDAKVAAILKSIFALSNDLDQNFLKRAGQPGNRMYKHSDQDSKSAVLPTSDDLEKRQSSSERNISEDAAMTTLSLSIRGASPTPPMQSIYSLSAFTATAPGSIPVSGIRMEGSVAVCTGRRSWSEEWAVLTAYNFTLSSSLTTKHHRVPSTIPLGTIRSVNVLTEEQKPFLGFEFFTIGTAAREFYFCVKNEYILSQWIDALLISQHTRTPSTSRDDGESNPQGGVMGDSMPEEPEACIVYPGNFAPSAARVLNHRYVAFRPDPCKTLNMSALELSKYLLIKILKICQRDGSSSPSKQSVNPVSSDWAEFCEKASQLQSISLNGLSKNGLVAFFLNLFHTILLHAFVVLGVPSSGIEWRSLKLAASYEVAGDLMSLKDIDEVILGNTCNKALLFNLFRVNISLLEAVKQIDSKRPRQMTPDLVFSSARLVLGELWDVNGPGPASPPIPLTSDWRVGLCVSIGCVDMPKEVVVYDEAHLDEQLDASCIAILEKGNVKIDTSPPSLLYISPSIILPRPLASIVLPGLTSTTPSLSPPNSTDGTNPGGASASSAPSMLEDPVMWLPQLLRYLSGTDVTLMNELLAQKNKINVFFAAPNFSSFSFLQLSPTAATPPPIHTFRSLQSKDDIAVIESLPPSPSKFPPRSVSTDGAASFLVTGCLEGMTDSQQRDGEGDTSKRNTFTVSEKPPTIPKKSKNRKVDIEQLRATLSSSPAASDVLSGDAASGKSEKRGIFNWKSKKNK